MAIAYTTGTINQPDAGSVGLAMVEKIRDDLALHAAWELVEEFTPGGGAVRWYVFKCLLGVSGLANDFFIVIGRTLATGELRFAICEGYNAGSHTMAFYSRIGSASPNFDSEGRNSSDTYTLSTVVFPSSGASPKYHAWIPSGTSTKWFICAADDGFTVAFNGASNGFVHCGGYVPLCEMVIPTPVILISSGSNQGELTRNPAVAGISASYNALVTDNSGGGAGDTSSLTPLGFMGNLQFNDKLQNNQRAVAESGIMIYNASATDSAVQGTALAQHKR